MVPEPHLALKPKHAWKRRRDQQQVIELPVKEGAADVRKNEPSIGGVQNTRAQAERIGAVRVRTHSKARMAQPMAIASTSLPRNSMSPPIYLLISSGEPDFSAGYPFSTPAQWRSPSADRRDQSPWYHRTRHQVGITTRIVPVPLARQSSPSTGWPGLASGSADGRLVLYDTQSWSLERSVAAHSKRITSIVFSPNGEYVVSGALDGVIRIWRTPSLSPARTIRSGSRMVYAVVCSPDATRLAAGCFDDRIRFFVMPEGAHEFTIEGHHNLVTALAFSFDGRRLVSGSHDNNVRIWRMPEGVPERTLDDKAQRSR